MADSPAPAELKPAPIKKFVTPFPGARKADGTSLELAVDQFLRAWGKTAHDGYYPLGSNGQWHGGIHFDEGTQAAFNQADGVRCLADGEVIAYRYDTKLPVSRYSDDERHNAKFSTSFVLVRHRLQVPPEIAPVGSNLPPPPSCVFYSLTMHLQHWEAYEDDATLKRPKFWGADPVKDLVRDTVHILPEPVEIKAGALVGHLGNYIRSLDLLDITQYNGKKRPKLHLEVDGRRSRRKQAGVDQPTVVHKPASWLNAQERGR
jgi:hypothetical protein